MSLSEPITVHRDAFKASRFSLLPRSPYPSRMANSPGNPLKFTKGSAWTSADLSLCNARVEDIDTATFFGVETNDFPVPNVSPAILHTKATYPLQPHSLNSQALTQEERLFFNYLEAAMLPGDRQTSSIIDFTVHVLHMLGYNDHIQSKLYPECEGKPCRHVICREHDIPLFSCGRTIHTTADACLLIPSNDHEGRNGDAVLLIVKAAPFTSPDSESSAEAQLFAQAIGAFQNLNRDRRRARLPVVESQIFLGLIMKGTTPYMYKVEITFELVESVQSGQKPPRSTVVHRLELPVDVAEGMIPIVNRKSVLGCLEALKKLI